MAIGATRRPVTTAVPWRRSRRRTAAEASKSFTFTFIGVVILAAFLAPLVHSFTLSIKSPEQVAAVDSPIWPATAQTYTYRDRDYPVYQVPLDSGTKPMALVKKGRDSSQFVDPANPDAELVTWQGSWRTLRAGLDTRSSLGELRQYLERDQLSAAALQHDRHRRDLDGRDDHRSCVLVAYGFARFRFPGRDWLFILVIATIFLPGAVAIIPTYTIFAKLGWVNTWLPLLVPAFFANAYDVFLLRRQMIICGWTDWSPGSGTRTPLPGCRHS